MNRAVYDQSVLMYLLIEYLSHEYALTLKAPITTAADDTHKFFD